MIMILSLVFDTLAQQLVGTTYRSISVAEDQGIGQVTRSEYYANLDTHTNAELGKSLCGRSFKTQNLSDV